MRAVRAKAVDRSDRFISSAFELLSEVGSEFSVQDVVDRSRTSLRSFYQSFEGKDDLFLAIYEEVMIAGLARQVEAAEGATRQPLDRLRRFLLAEWEELDAAGPKMNRALVVYHQRLAETRPSELAAVLEPQHQALTDLVRECREAGLVRNELSDEANATLLVHLLAACMQARVLDVRIGGQDMSGELLWSFVAATFAPQPT